MFKEKNNKKRVLFTKIMRTIVYLLNQFSIKIIPMKHGWIEKVFGYVAFFHVPIKKINLMKKLLNIYTCMV